MSDIKFFRRKDANIVTVALVNDDGTKEKLAIIGQVSELLEKEIIFLDNTYGNMDKWLMIDKDGKTIREYDSKAEAKDAATYIYGI